MQKVVHLQYADPDAMKQVLEVFGCCAISNLAFRTLSLSYPPAVLPAVEDVIRRFDVPAAAPKGIEVTAYFLLASEKEPGDGAPVPRELEPVIAQLRSVFAYKAFSVLDCLLLRMSSGESGLVSGKAPAAVAGQKGTSTMLEVRRWSLRRGDGGDVVTLESLRAFIIENNSSAGVDRVSRLDVPVGQKVVVGKSDIEGPAKALIVVLSARTF